MFESLTLLFYFRMDNRAFQGDNLKMSQKADDSRINHGIDGTLTKSESQDVAADGKQTNRTNPKETAKDQRSAQGEGSVHSENQTINQENPNGKVAPSNAKSLATKFKKETDKCLTKQIVLDPSHLLKPGKIFVFKKNGL